MKKGFVLLALSVMFFTGIAFSQIRDIPKAVEETFANQYKGASNIDFKDQLVRVDVYFDLDGEKMIASYTNKGLWKETQKEWSFVKLPEEIKNALTGLDAIDSIICELKETGYLHNHKRMWFAAYLIHYAKVEWRHGESFFYHYLLDGEPGPNALSWQWVASTFSGKPYYFNAQNMNKNNHFGANGSLLDDNYENLNAKYFAGYADGSYAKRPQEQPMATGEALFPDLLRPAGYKPLIVLQGERLSDGAKVLKVAIDAPVVVILDAARFKKEQPSFMRLHFAVSLAADVVKTLRQQGREAELMMLESDTELVDYAKVKNCESIAAADSWHPDTWLLFKRLDKQLPVSIVEDIPFIRVKASLRSFSSFWDKAEPQLHWR